MEDLEARTNETRSLGPGVRNIVAKLIFIGARAISGYLVDHKNIGLIGQDIGLIS